MTAAVFDASVTMAWAITLPWSPSALEAQKTYDAHAPAFILVEMANALRKYVRHDRIDESDALTALSDLPDAIRLAPDGPLVRQALSLAVQLDHAVYDCLYAALAIRMTVPLITADRRLHTTLIESGTVESVMLTKATGDLS